MKSLTLQVDAATRVSALLLAPARPMACYVLAHGAGAGMAHPFMAAVADELGERGVATLRYQFPYMEHGSKRPDVPKMAHATVRAAVAEAAGQLPDTPLFAGGKSFGGRMTSQAQATSPLPGVRGLVFLGFPLHPAGKPSAQRADHLSSVNIPMLFLQGTRDELADLSLLAPVVEGLGSRAQLHVVEDADHSFHVPARSGRRDGEVRAGILDVAAAWMRATLLAAGLAGCATPGPPSSPPFQHLAQVDQARLLDRVTWGANASSQRHLEEVGAAAFLEEQLHPRADAPLPAPIQARIDAMSITTRPVAALAVDMEQRRKGAQAMPDDAAKKAAMRAFRQQMAALAREAAGRSVLRAIYSPNQLQEQMTWFWMNHFSVFQRKAELRALVADYEENAVRPHALGRFRDLLAATLRHPAMIRYLDNARNAAHRINENYARELLELHTMGVDGGYTQRDVQELARVLTGVGMRAGRFEFHPRLHDGGDKVILGHTIHGRGHAEVDEVLDIVCRHPSTARFVSRKLATFFVADDPPAALVERMARTFRRTDGDIAATLETMFDSVEFARSLGGKFKDPMHYVVSAGRLLLDERPIPDVAPLLMWLGRLGELPNDHATPDGYPLVEAAWSSPGQMTARFEFAHAVGARSAAPIDRPVSAATRAALDAAASPRERNALLLSSPDFMYR